MTTTQGTVSAPQSYTLTAQQLTTPITITAPSNFEVSSDNATYSGTLNLPQTTSPATIYARLTGATQGAVSGNITNVSGSLTATVAVSGSVNPTPGTFAKISAIQGAGNTAALTGVQAIEGIVTRVFSGSAGQNGFYVQEEDADQDGNPATSEGIFCFDPSGLFTGTIGNKVQVTGTAVEYTSTSGGVNSSLTQLSTLTSVINKGPGTLPAATLVTLPFAVPTGGVSALERYEAMLIQLSAATGNLTVTETFGLGRYGQITLSATDATNQPGTDGRIDQYTQFNVPSVSGYAAYEAAVDRRQILLDDASSVQYPATIIHSRGSNPLTANNTLRGGDDVASITAILDERFDGYRLQTNTGVNFNAANPRPASPSAVGGTLKTGFANVLNYFTTFGATNDRGADNANEFARQRAKVIANLIGLGADIIGLSEIQNKTQNDNGLAGLQDLVGGMNAATAPNTYTFITPNAQSATDFITVAIVYKPASVSLVGPAVPIPASYGTGSYGVVGRSAIAQTFQQTPLGGIFTLVANHWKSKGSASAGAGNADAGDGQGASAAIRTQQAQDLLSWIGTKPTGTADADYLIVGDLNAYARETPLTTLETGGYTALIPNSSYSFAFKGEWGALDHALANGTLQPQITGATKWYINADEPTVLDYNTENKTTTQQTSLFNPDQYRSADHDPLVIGLNLVTALPVQLMSFEATVAGDQVALSWETASERDVSRFVVERSSDAREFLAVGQVTATGKSETRKSYGLVDTKPLLGTSYYRLRTIDRDGSSQTSKVVSVTLDDITPSMALLGNPISGSTIRLAVRNMNGATYQVRSLTGQTLPTVITARTDRTVDLQLNPSVPAGLYLIEGKLGTVRQTLKVLID